jgi:hypothetical protein
MSSTHISVIDSVKYANALASIQRYLTANKGTCTVEPLFAGQTETQFAQVSITVPKDVPFEFKFPLYVGLSAKYPPKLIRTYDVERQTLEEAILSAFSGFNVTAHIIAGVTTLIKKRSVQPVTTPTSKFEKMITTVQTPPGLHVSSPVEVKDRTNTIQYLIEGQLPFYIDENDWGIYVSMLLPANDNIYLTSNPLINVILTLVPELTTYITKHSMVNVWYYACQSRISEDCGFDL